MFQNINPTKTTSWKKLVLHHTDIKHTRLKDLFHTNPNREKKFTLQLEQLSFDFSKNKITDKTLELLENLAVEMNLKSGIESLFNGEKINITENRAVLHTALREFNDYKTTVDGEPIYPLINDARLKVKEFTKKIITGIWKGYSGKPIDTIVNIGIGGSDLGPQMVVESLKFYSNHLKTFFISNVDGDAVQNILNKINPETTLFIVVSKTFTTVETLTNATTCKNWLLQNTDIENVKKHFVAVSTNQKAVTDFGIDKTNIFPMWNWVGGRFSMWSSVGLSIALSIGYDYFEDFLKGANAADIHFRNTTFKENIPVIMGLLSIWSINFNHVNTEAILPYAETLNKLVPYLQQLFMESNGKSVDKNGESVNYSTGSVLFGSTGTNAQHSFMQLVHQGTQSIPVDFIGFQNPLYGNEEHHKILMANLMGQSQALMEGKTKEAVHLDMKFHGSQDKINKLLPYKVFKGNRVSNIFLFDKLTPYNLGMLIALYEHKVFVQGVLWNINSFDQFGVELGKEIAKRYTN
jgi:glucose-6-phosphate isomerase